MTAPFCGRYCDGQHPVDHEVSVTRVDKSLLIQGSSLESSLSWPFAQLKAQSLAEGTLYLHSSSDATLLVFHEISEAYQSLPGVNKDLSRSPRQKIGAIICLLLACMGLFLLSSKALDPIAHEIAHHISPQKERELFAPEVSLWESDPSACHKSPAADVLTRLGQSLSPEEQKLAPIDFVLVDWDLENAFALPGRRILITRGLLQRLETPEQLAAILAHEIGHVHLRHNLQTFVRHSLSAGIWGVLVGDFSGAFLLDPQLAQSLSQLAHSRELEKAADHFSAERLFAFQYDPQSLTQALELLEKKAEDERALSLHVGFGRVLERMEEWTSSHPSLTERKNLLASFIRPKVPKTALSQADWSILQKACRPE
jgi:Zn-dependent protease with chaperone function